MTVIDDVDVGRISVSTGPSLNVATMRRESTATPLMLLPAYADSWRAWSRVLPSVAQERTVVAVDPRGQGDSDRPACCFAVDDVVRDLVALLDALEIQRAVVVGHSGSCFAARRLAVLHADRVAGLGLISSPVALDREDLRDFVDAVDELTDPVPIAFVRDFQAGASHYPLPAWFLDEIVAESMKMPARVWRDTLQGLLDYRDAPDLARIEAPTILIWGERDTIVPRSDQDVQLGAIDGAVLTVLPDTGHSPHWERPEAVVPLLLELAERSDKAARGTSENGANEGVS